ncbi:beta-ketoacyl synthase N-terminal-like domain-containing protein, partial [Streptomyces anulatus]|uniref:beta-ketoacyl synthase N-terminal-like domain-containing protein n=1 Tax=Streptomyces anulatus TaxID=1892 RepID=UPI00364C9652
MDSSRSPSPDPSDPIVLTGIGCVLPGTPDVHSFWSHVSTGTSQVSRLESRGGGAAPGAGPGGGGGGAGGR